MRVIAGIYKGRTLIAPKSQARPTLDRTKETLFNILHFKLKNATVLDLFAGSGQLAIESLSRGANRAVLCDCDKDAISAIKTNLEKVGAQAEVFFCDYSACLAKQSGKFDVIFVDPPYKAGLYNDVLNKIAQYGLLSNDGVIVCEHSADDLIVNGKFELFDERKIGTVKFSFFKSIDKGE